MKVPHTELLFEEALNKAKGLYVMGHTNKYIELHLADKKYPDSVIDGVILQISQLRKAERRQNGIQKLFFGCTIIAAACLTTYFSFHSDSPVGILMAGTGILGVFVAVKGILQILNFE